MRIEFSVTYAVAIGLGILVLWYVNLSINKCKRQKIEKTKQEKEDVDKLERQIPESWRGLYFAIKGVTIYSLRASIIIDFCTKTLDPIPTAFAQYLVNSVNSYGCSNHDTELVSNAVAPFVIKYLPKISTCNMPDED